MIVIPGSFTLLHLVSDAESGGLNFFGDVFGGVAPHCNAATTQRAGQK